MHIEKGTLKCGFPWMKFGDFGLPLRRLNQLIEKEKSL